MTEPRLGLPDLGVGCGLRVPHYRQIFAERPAIDFLEVISENFMAVGGKPRYHLEQALESYRLVQHGVSLNIGGPDPLDREYLSKLKQLVRRVNPPWLSDHFCWCGADGAHLHDLLPLPYTEEAIELVVERAKMVQDYLEVPFALENTSSYLTYTQSVMSEQAFISEIAERANIGLMFDVNNVYVSAYNHQFDPLQFIHQVPHDRIVQIHLAGHTNLGDYIIDTHNGPVIDPVLELYRETIELCGPVSTLIEWDDDIPTLEVLLAEVERIREVRALGLSSRAAREARGQRPEPRVGERGYVPARRPADAAAAPGWNQGGPREQAGPELVLEADA